MDFPQQASTIPLNLYTHPGDPSVQSRFYPQPLIKSNGFGMSPDTPDSAYSSASRAFRTPNPSRPRDQIMVSGPAYHAVAQDHYGQQGPSSHPFYSESQSSFDKLKGRHQSLQADLPPPPYQSPNLSRNQYIGSQDATYHNGLDKSDLARVQLHPSSSSAESAQPQMEDQDAVAKMLSWMPPTPRRTKEQMVPLQKPIAIPQIDKGRLGASMPFIRAYSPVLASHEIDPTTFVAFIDNLAIAQAAPPPFQAMNFVGMGLGFVPHHWAQLAGNGVGLASGLGSAVVTKTRTKLYLDKVNVAFFAPRGLKVSVCKHEELNDILRVPDTIPILGPLDATTASFTIPERRIHALSAYISPLTLNVPPPAAQTKVLDKLTDKQVRATIEKNKKKITKERQKHLVTGQPPLSSSVSPVPSIHPSSSDPENDTDTSSRINSRLSNADHQETGLKGDPDSYQRKLQILELRMQQINLRADQASLSCSRVDQLDEIEVGRRREMVGLQKEREMLEWNRISAAQSHQHLPSGSDEQAKEKKSRKQVKEEEKQNRKEAKKEEKQEKKEKKKNKGDRVDRKDKASKAEEKEVKTAMKLDWLVVENLEKRS